MVGMNNRVVPVGLFGFIFLFFFGSTGFAEINMLFFGDVMVERRIETIIQEKGIPHFFSGVTTLPDGRYITDFDLVSANLEGAVTEGGEHYPPVYPYDFAFPPERIEALKEQGITYLTIANNHLFDQGADGVASTRRFLTDLEIDHSGDLDSVVSEESVVLIGVGDKRVAMVGLSEVYRPLDRQAVMDLLGEVDSRVDATVVNIHWGVEYEHIPRKHQRDMAIILARSGVDLIVGHHPHVSQGVEFVGKTPVFYSLGNFIFDQGFNDEVRQGLAVAFTGDIVEGVLTGHIDLFPYRAEGYVPRWLQPDERTDRLGQIAEWSCATDSVKEEIRRGRIVFGSESP
jgi:hypothetical protein